MRRLIIPLALVLALLVAGVATAAFRSGTYSGKTTFSGPVSFSATQSKLRYLKVGVVFNCTDGDRFQTVLRNFPAQNIVNGRYSATFTGADGATRYTHSGTIVGTRATGRLVGTRRYDTNDQLDPDGTVVCRTGRVGYSILKK